MFIDVDDRLKGALNSKISPCTRALARASSREFEQIWKQSGIAHLAVLIAAYESRPSAEGGEAFAASRSGTLRMGLQEGKPEREADVFPVS